MAWQGSHGEFNFPVALILYYQIDPTQKWENCKNKTYIVALLYADYMTYKCRFILGLQHLEIWTVLDGKGFVLGA